MVKMNSAPLISSLLLFISSFTAFPQKGVQDGSRYGHGEDSIRCIKNLSLYRENAKHENYKDAITFWRIVFNECPQSTQNIYIDGARMYNDFIQKESDPATQSALLDTLMMVYDQRVKYYGQKGSVLGRKGVDLLRYKRDDIEKLLEGYNYLKESVMILKDNSSVAVLATFMQASFTLYEHDRITDTQVIDDYAATSGILDHILANDPDDTDAGKVREFVDVGFIVSGATTCESLIGFFSSDYDRRRDDAAYLRKVVSFLRTLDCNEDPFYTRAAEDLYTLEPGAEPAYNLAKLFVTKEQFDKAVGYYLEAIEYETDPLMKADYYYQLGVITNVKMNEPEKAREYALEAIANRPDWGEPYILIGDAYATCKDCFNDEFEKNTLYWAAVDKFIAAKNIDSAVSEKANERIDTYSKYFPDVETVFFYGLQEGDPYTVGSWINETTKVRAK